MASSDNNSWIAETVGDFIHSKIWGAPINTFIEANCATFDYDDDELMGDDDTTRSSSPSSSVEEQKHVHLKYQRLADSLIEGLGKDLDLDQNELKQVCQLPTVVDSSVIIDESFEQLYAARDFQLFQEMMRRKNLILQLQALVSLQLQWGLLKQSDAGDDLILSLLLQATSASSRHGSVKTPSARVDIRQISKKEEQNRQDDPDANVDAATDDDDDDNDIVFTQSKSSSSGERKETIEQKKSPEYTLPDLRPKGGTALNAKWHRDLHLTDDYDGSKQTDSSSKTSTPQTIGAIPEEVLREKLRELTIRTTESVDDETNAAIQSRKNFLQQQRNLIVNKQRAERIKDLEQQTPNARPQSAAHVARNAMGTTTKANENKQAQEVAQISEDELNKRRAMAAKLRREVIDKR